MEQPSDLSVFILCPLQLFPDLCVIFLLAEVQPAQQLSVLLLQLLEVGKDVFATAWGNMFVELAGEGYLITSDLGTEFSV